MNQHFVDKLTLISDRIRGRSGQACFEEGLALRICLEPGAQLSHPFPVGVIDCGVDVGATFVAEIASAPLEANPRAEQIVDYGLRLAVVGLYFDSVKANYVAELAAVAYALGLVRREEHVAFETFVWRACVVDQRDQGTFS